MYSNCQVSLNIQKELRQNGGNCEFIKNKYGINYHEYPELNLVIFNYDQIKSHKTEQIVSECRGLVLEKETWNVVFYPFHRFFNYFEQDTFLGEFNYTNAVALQKIDGTMLGVWNYNGKWYISTRSCIGGKNKNNFDVSMEYLFKKAISGNTNSFFNKLNEHYSYCFELVGPDNKIVTQYDTNDLYLLSIRNENGHEMKYCDVIKWAEQNNFKYPKTYKFTDLNSLRKLSESFNATDEGIVCCDDSSCYEDNVSFKRIKVKNPAYLAIAHIKSGASTRRFVYLVLTKESDEFLSYFPEFKDRFNEIKRVYQNWIDLYKEEYQKAKPYFDKDQKTFALFVKDFKFKTILFLIKNKKINDIYDYIEQQLKTKEKAFCKALVDTWKIKDVEYTDNEG